jgi:hypothetical protein
MGVPSDSAARAFIARLIHVAAETEKRLFPCQGRFDKGRTSMIDLLWWIFFDGFVYVVVKYTPGGRGKY